MNEPHAAQAGRSERLRPLRRPLWRRVVSVLLWVGVLALGAFGVTFSFANYPVFGISVLLLILLAIGYSEQSRRKERRTLEEARKQKRARSQDLLNG